MKRDPRLSAVSARLTALLSITGTAQRRPWPRTLATLECGHELPYFMLTPPKRMACYQCGPKRATANGEGGL